MIGEISLFIQEVVRQFAVYSNDNPVIAGALSLWFLGVFSLLAKNLPKDIWHFIKKQSTTELSILSSSEAFHNFLMWYNQRGYDKNLRSFKISSGRWGDDDAVKSIGYGTHFFIYGWRPGLITLTQQEAMGTERERDKIEITIIGRNQKIYDKIFNGIVNVSKGTDEFEVRKYHEYWQRLPTQTTRKMNTIFLNKGVKEKLLDFIDNFIRREDWYKDHGISYQTGIILYGIPGSGKTSLVKSLASYYKDKLYILPASRLRYIQSAMDTLPHHAMVLIEDIDSDSSTWGRFLASTHEESKPKVVEAETSKSGDPGAGAVTENPAFNYSLSNLSDVLNSIDGIVTTHGRILIITTNHIERLDDALIRDGRFDLKIKLDYADEYAIRNFMKSFYPNYKIDKDIEFKKNISISKLQNIVLSNLDNPEIIVKKISV